MKGLTALVVLAAFHGPAQPHQTDPTCTAKDFRAFSAKVWDPAQWDRPDGKPKAAAITAQRRRLACAGPANRHAMKHIWRGDKAAYYEHRRQELWRVRVTPFYGGGNWWAIPYGMVLCESGGNYRFPYGAYSMLDPAWHEWGGQTAHAGEASEREQDLAAHHGWLLYGESAWECKADGSTSWP